MSFFLTVGYGRKAMNSRARDQVSIEDPLIDDRQLARLADVSPRTPAQWRYLGKFKDELPYIKIGRNVRYRQSVALSFLDACTVGGDDKGGDQ